jgi:hypothetical protein
VYHDRKDPIERLLNEGHRTPTGCWVGVGHVRPETGYAVGRFWVDGVARQWRVHRLAYLLFVGPLDDDLTIDHLCKNRACCEPTHLEQITAAENALRGNGPPAHNARTRVCVAGHNDWGVRQGRYRYCKECARQRSRESRARSRR